MTKALLELNFFEDGLIVVKHIGQETYYKLGLSETKCLLDYLENKNVHVKWKCADEEKAKNLIRNAEEPDMERKSLLLEKFRACGFGEVSFDKKKRGFEFKSFSRIQLCRFEAGRLIEKIPSALCGVYSGPGILAILTASILMLYPARFCGKTIIEDLAAFEMGLRDIFLAAAMVIFSLFFHETAHAMSCRYYGGKVRWMGIILYFFIPCPFCDVSDMYIMESRRKKIFISLAGVAANALFGDVVLGIYCLLAVNGKSLPVLIYFWAVNLLTIIFNLIPFVKLDGYWILSAVTGITNLMDKALLRVKEIFVKPKTVKPMDFQHVYTLVFGMAVTLFRPVFWAMSIYSIYGVCQSVMTKKAIYVIPALLIAAAITDEILFIKKLVKKK